MPARPAAPRAPGAHPGACGTAPSGAGPGSRSGAPRRKTRRIFSPRCQQRRPGRLLGAAGGCLLRGGAGRGTGSLQSPPHTPRVSPTGAQPRCSCRWGWGRAAAPGSLRVFGSPKAAGGPARAWRGCQAQSPTWEAAKSAYGPGRWHPVWGRRVCEAKRKCPNTAPGRLAGTSGGTGCGMSPGVGAEGLILPGFPTP